MRKTALKKAFRRFLLIAFVISQFNFAFSREVKLESDKYETLVTLKILEDTGNLDTNVTRAEFSKFLVRASKFRDKVPEYITEDVCNDVKANTPYAPYIKKVLEEGYMFTYLDGSFKPEDLVTFSDLSRACLALLSYTNDDFRGNQVIGRNLKFRALKLDENIEKNESDILTKKDIANGIYNTLKERVKDSNEIYGETVFEDLIIDADNEINASEYIEINISGPYFIKSDSNIEVGFELNKNVFINGIKYSINELREDISNFGYAICYADKDRQILYAYTERQDIDAPIILRKGYVYKIYYSAANMLIPYRVDIDKYKYFLDSEEVKYAFSANGSFKEDDNVVYICNKMNDKGTAYKDASGKVINTSDEAEPYNGSIIMAFDVSMIR